MSEGWEDCPVLPVGWKRREVFRRSGATIGKSDTYYMSPTSERFRSKVELVKHFGDSLDLTYFDFKKGIILPQNSKIRKAAKRSSTSSCEGEEHDKRPTPRKKARVSATTPPPTSPSQLKVGKGSATSGLDSEPMDTLIACCEDCQQWVPGVMFGARKKKFKFYCAECRARRREVGRKLNYYKRFGCGECSSCTLAGDCGVCRGCLLRTAEPTRNWKCVKRRCHKLRDIKAEATCRKTTGKPKKKANSQFEGVKKAMKKVKAEPVALVKEPVKAIKPDPVLEEEDGGEELQGETDWQNKEQEHHIPAQGHTAQESPGQLFTAMPILGSEDVRSDYSVKSEFLLKGTRTRRSNRCCGECEACLMPVDCGSCDFCQDKAKFGGFNTLRQKCRWKQCLQFASKRLLPRETQSQHPERKEPGFWSGHRRWRENSFASRKVARAIQAAKKRKIWQALPSTSEGGGQDREGQGNRKPSGRLHREPVPLGGQTEDFQRTELRVQREIETPDSTEGRAQCQQEISVKTPALAEPHDRPSVIKETSSEHKRRQPIEEPLTHQHAGKPRVKADISERQAEPHLTATPKRKLESLSNRSISQELQQRNWSGGPANRNVPHQERDSEVIPPLIVSPVSRNSKGEQRTTSNQQSASPKRPAEPEVSAAGVPSNSQIVRATAPAPSPAYRKSTPAAREGGQLGASQCPEGRAGASASDDDVCGVPVITQIFSLGSPYMMMNLEPRLRTFMQELMLLPLPASWVVCSSLGPDIQLLQLSRKSPVWDAAVQIRPGFTFHVLVRGLAVPLGHRLYRSHPARLGSVDDVVELIGDLERYRVCAGYPQHRHAKAPPAALAALLPRERSAYCEVLVDKEHCFQCSGNL